MTPRDLGLAVVGAIYAFAIVFAVGVFLARVLL